MKLSELKQDDPEAVVAEEAAPAAEEPWGVAQVVAPNGLEIYYQAGPKRLYKVRNNDVSAEWREVPSASTVLQVLEKGGLSHWGQGVGVSGVLELIALGELRWVD